MRRVMGMAAFGLHDAVWMEGRGLSEEDFAVYDVLLPTEALGTLRAGDEAEQARVHTGLNWPLDARLEKNLRRAPLPVVWRAMVEAGDRPGVWHGPGGFDWSLGRLLAQHLEQLLKKYSDPEAEVSPVIAMADGLDEMAQESLLREMQWLGLPEAYLLWRPVAAALAWLDGSGDQVLDLKLGDDDHIHIIYLGADALEFTTLRLRRKTLDNGRTYILPLRDRPKARPEFTGLDWAGQLMEQCCPDDAGAFWQLLTTFPEVWEAVAGRSKPYVTPPSAWSTKDGWRLWNIADYQLDPWQVSIGPCDLLRKILNESCPLARTTDEFNVKFAQWFWEKLTSMESSCQAGRLLGVVVCGPLLADENAVWLDDFKKIYSRQGIDDISILARPGRIWLSPGNEAIAYGAQIYGRRLLNGEPTYLDTLPQLSLLAQQGGQYEWRPLLDAQVVDGGQHYEDRIEKQYQLGARSSELNVYLRKGEGQDMPDGRSNKAIDDSAKARLIRAWVRREGSADKVLTLLPPNWVQSEKDYAIGFAHDLFSPNRSVIGGQGTASTDSPYRLATVKFPAQPDHDVPLDVKVYMKPASGLARISFIPDDHEVFNGRDVHLNFSTMTPVESLPKQTTRGWPELMEILVDPSADALVKNQHLISRFVNTQPVIAHGQFAGSYTDGLKKIRDKVLKSPRRYDIRNWCRSDYFSNTPPQYEFVVLPISELGTVGNNEGQKFIDIICKKIDNDFMIMSQNGRRNDLYKLVNRSYWMYLGAPQTVKCFVRQELKRHKDLLNESKDNWNFIVSAAGKILRETEDLKLVFQAISYRIKTANGSQLSTRFPKQAQKAVCDLLMYRKDATAALCADWVKDIANMAVARVREESENNNYVHVFYHSVLLLLYLLRYREIDKRLMAIDNTDTMKRYETTMDFLRESIIYYQKCNDQARASKSLEILKNFESYVKFEATLDVPVALAEAADGA